MDMITDWAQVVADRLIDSVRCVMDVQGLGAEQALECVLSQSCAGPKAIERAQVALGLLRKA